MLGLVMLVVPALPACSESKSDGIKGSAGKTKENDEDEDDTSDDEMDDMDDAADDGGDALSLEQIIGQCGIDPSDLENRDKILVDKKIRSWPKVFIGAQAAPIVGNVNYRVQVTTVIEIKATLAEVKQTTEFDIKAEPSKAEPPAREKVAPLRGTSTAKSLTMDERSALMGEDDAWSGVFCTVMPVKELSTSRGGKGKIVKFTPALPSSISPKADPGRYQAEIGQGRTFNNIEAEIIGSSDPAFPQGKKIKGRVTVTPTEPTLTLNVNGGGQQSIKTDAAFKMTWEFGTVEETVGIGLMPSQTIFISHKERDFKAIVADTGFKEGGVAVLSEDL